MRIAVSQLNPTLGDFAANSEKIISDVAKASLAGVDLVVFPEAVLFGYHPFDLLERTELVDEQLSYLQKIHSKVPPGLSVLLGAITRNPNRRGRPYFNSAVLLQKGKAPRFFHKQLLPTGDVFDEARFIESGDLRQNFFTMKAKSAKTGRIKSYRCLVTICEDIWAWPEADGSSQYQENPLLGLKGSADLVVNLSASPYYPQKLQRRQHLVKKTARHFGAPVVYANLVGGQDEIIFDGQSFAVNATGRSLLQCQGFAEDFRSFNLDDIAKPLGEHRTSIDQEVRQALVLGIRDFCHKTGLRQVHLGLSGGVDSALVACLAVEALGPENVKTIAMPGPFSAGKSLRLAQQLADNLQVEMLKAPIAQLFREASRQLRTSFGLKGFGITQENLQARLRGILLMAYSNAENSLLLSTSNKSEAATGYTTLYGDMCGGLAPIADLTKEQVYRLCSLYNHEQTLIPKPILTRAPSAELRPNQKDSDSLPQYSKLDVAVRHIVEEAKPAKNELETWLIGRVLQTEFKRWQAPPILKVSRHSFGRGRRYPIARAGSSL